MDLKITLKLISGEKCACGKLLVVNDTERANGKTFVRIMCEDWSCNKSPRLLKEVEFNENNLFATLK